MASVAIVEDHLLLAETLRAALQRRDITVHLLAPKPADQLVAELRGLRADLTLLDLDLGPCGDGTALVAPLVRDGLRVLVVTGSADRIAIAAALEQGALGYQLKEAGFEALLAKAEQGLNATGPLDVGERAQLLNELARFRAERAQALAPFEQLTAREQETLRALGRGLSVADIAEAWFVSEATVRTHVRRVLEKLGVNSQHAAVAEALRAGWL